MIKLANNKKIIDFSKRVASAMEMETEEILLHSEEVVKKYVPAKKVKATLLKIEKSLEKEGIEALFDKSVTREAIRKTASEEVSETEIDELVEEIVKAVVEELEDVLEDADELCDEKVAEFDDEEGYDVECKLKDGLEKIMASKGVYFKLARNQKKKEKTSLLDKIKNDK